MFELSLRREWDELFQLLRRAPSLVHAASEPKGYTALHQGAWHGASLAVIGKLLAMGADRSLKTRNKHQTALDIVIEKHADRADLKYVLACRRHQRLNSGPT